MSSYYEGDREYSNDVEPDGDAAFDSMQERIDRGDECPDCHNTHGIRQVTSLGIDCFVCTCGCRWFDFVTRPTQDDRTLDMFPELLMYGDRMEFA